jgi:hypothetical protein
MSEKVESFSLFLNSFSYSPYITNKISIADVIFTINWDAVFNGKNHKYNACKIRHEFISDNAPLSNPFTPNNNNGVLVVNGINSRTTSVQGGTILGLIQVGSVSATTSNVSHQSVISNNFIASIPVGVGTTTSVMTINSTSSPLFMLAVGDYISWYNATAFTTNGYTTPVGYVQKIVASVTGGYTYTLNNPDGSSFVNSTTTAIVNAPFTCGNPVNYEYTFLTSTTLQSGVGQQIEVPRGMRTLEVQLCNNNYGQLTSATSKTPEPALLSGTNLQDWALILNFEFSEPIDDKYGFNA